jgi:hypothetical protein
MGSLTCDLECWIRLDAALAVLELSAARLRDVVNTGGSDAALDAACAAVRLSTARFMAAQAECRDLRDVAA